MNKKNINNNYISSSRSVKILIIFNKPNIIHLIILHFFWGLLHYGRVCQKKKKEVPSTLVVCPVEIQKSQVEKHADALRRCELQ